MSGTFGQNHQPIFVGVETKQANRRRKNIPPAAELAERIRDTGATVDQIAAQYNVSVSKVARALNDAGFRRNGASTFQRRPVTQTDARLPIAPHRYVREDGELAGALCATSGFDADIWFPETAYQRNTTGALAKQICAECPVRLACLRRRLEVEEVERFRSGIWGGLDEDERAALAEEGAA